MRGSSALQHALDLTDGEDVRVVVAWEPILVTDIAAPRTALLARVHDPHAVQLWDPSHVASRLLLQGLQGQDADAPHVPIRGGVAWDVVALYPPEASWDSSLPRPTWAGGPVLDVARELPSRLRALVPAGR